ncbi:hypothetical protein GV751_21900, partial [Enterobacter hormaechei]|nr:hypothetical protein [Enterobacter hormaechei]NBF72331.1 hypothetical protein [Enterobacter hormaechei]NBG13106.1 hypothetical protein [Enterobacter hormaechei]
MRCQESPAHLALRPVNWCSRLLKMTTIMENIALIGIDLGKNSFHIHCQDRRG